LKEKKDFLSIRQAIIIPVVTGAKQIVKFQECGIFFLPGNPYNLCAVISQFPDAPGHASTGTAYYRSTKMMQLNFKQIGETGKPLIILHGVFGFLDNWLTIGKTLSEQGYRVYLVDQRNHGRSPHEAPLNFPTLAADLKEFLEQQHIESPILIGHSMGGKTVMEYAVTYPGTFDALVVVDIGPKAYPIHHTKILKGLNAIPLDQIESRNQADEVLSEYEPLLGVRIKSDKPVETPTLFMRGANSNYVLDEDLEGILDLFPNAQLKTIEGAGHWVQAEQPKAFVSTLLEFLNEAI
jgi:esterase